MKVDQKKVLFLPRNVVYGTVQSTMWAWNVQFFRPPCRSRVLLAWAKGNFISVSFTLTCLWNSVLATLLAFQFPEHWKSKTFSLFILEYSMAPPWKPGIRNGEVCIWKPHEDAVIHGHLCCQFFFSGILNTRFLENTKMMFIILLFQGREQGLPVPLLKREVKKTKKARTDSWTRLIWFAGATESERRFTTP